MIKDLKRVVITGMRAITPQANTVQTNLAKKDKADLT